LVLSSAPLGSSNSPRSAETFPCTSTTRRTEPAATAGAQAPVAHRCCGRGATPSTPTNTAPRGAAAHRPHPACCTRPPPAESRACTAPRIAVDAGARPARDPGPPRA
jgi:hypothetical protein